MRVRAKASWRRRDFVPVVPWATVVGDHEQGHRAGGGGDHAGARADKGDHNRHAEGGVDTNLGIDAGDNGEGDGFRDEGEGDNRAGDDVADGVTEPLLLVAEGGHEDGKGARIEERGEIGGRRGGERRLGLESEKERCGAG